ncbi:hypothetical protein SDRG_12109 [Saprolegnia diclina VS20]|uniref:F-box domain-containing protein n=1 Tax=Saprolegnia diclina (strain VS20) TaxID=1156394 RepID=T0PXJ1_SAPDV|nr:hypothetical protein SDRG_12109 [Saprolegnia diclina VS20]EQC30259.1 hypothetical protein SDRG_12109 [Saprolegnia diclina VS20]|eukprot:XP_008616391.1 hypothetical protein SDRG_12109 [Saprolegnia diclina VS20]
MAKRTRVAPPDLAPELLETIAAFVPRQHEVDVLLRSLPAAQLSTPLLGLRTLFAALYGGRLGVDGVTLWPRLCLPHALPDDAALLAQLSAALSLYRGTVALSWSSARVVAPASTSIALTLPSPMPYPSWPSERLTALSVTLSPHAAWTRGALLELCAGLRRLPVLARLCVHWAQAAEDFGYLLQAITHSHVVDLELHFARDDRMSWNADAVTTIASWLQSRPVTALKLGYLKVDEPSVAAFCAALHACRTLQSLSLDQGALAHSYFVDTQVPPTLTSLTVHGCRYAGMRSVMACLQHAQLETLHLSFLMHEQRKDDELLRFVTETLPTLPRLMSLDLPHYSFCPASIAAYVSLAPQLRDLNFETGQIKTQAGADALIAALPLCAATLRSFKMSNLLYSTLAMTRALAHCTALTHVTLRGSRLGVDGATAIAAAMASLPLLQELNLSSNAIGSGGATAIADAAVSHCHRLVDLNLKTNGITCDGAAALSRLLPQLVSLELGLNQIGRDGARALAIAIPSSMALRWLGLGYNAIGVDGLLAMIEAVAMAACPWQRIGVSATGTDDAAIAICREAIRRLSYPYVLVL